LAIFDYNKQNKQLEMSLKLLTEDYDKAIKGEGLHSYFEKHFILELNTEKLTPQYLGAENEYEFTWLYFTYDVEISPKNNIIQIENSLLKSTNKNQFNTVKINLFNQSQVHNFSPSQNNYTFVFKD
jgi:hypothetical protein